MGFLHWRCQAFVYFSFSTFLFLGLVRGAWADEWEKVVGAAKKEGKVVVSVPASAKLRKQMEKVFEQRFAGIDLKPVPGRGSKSIRRISDEYKAGVRYFDVHVGGSSLAGHIAEWPVGRYYKAHHHHGGAILLILRSQGYTLMWPKEAGNRPYKNGNGDQVVKVDWKEESRRGNLHFVLPLTRENIVSELVRR